MAWNEITVTVGEEQFSGHVNGDTLSLPYTSGIKVGDAFDAGGNAFKAVLVTDIAERNETLLVVMEKVNDKPKARGTKPQSGKPDVQVSSDDGHNDEDRN